MRIRTIAVLLAGIVGVLMTFTLGRPVYWALYERMYPMKSARVTGFERHDAAHVYGHDTHEEMSEVAEDIDDAVAELHDSIPDSHEDEDEEPQTTVFEEAVPSPPPPPPAPPPSPPPFPEGVEEEEAHVAMVPSTANLGLAQGYADPPDGPILVQQYGLTKQRIQRIISANPNHKMIMVTWANFHYLDFVMNWVTHLRNLGVSNFIVGAMDQPMLQALVERRVSTFSMASGLTTGDFGWGTKTFHKMGRSKIELIQTFTELGFDILLSDVDTVWQRDPNTFFNKYMDADVLTSSDHLTETIVDGGLEQWPQANSAANIGIMLFRHTAKAMAKAWVEALKKDPLYWDQNAFNDLMRRGAYQKRANEKRLFVGFDGKTMIGILPVSLFCSGHSFFVTRMPQRHNLGVPFVVHATFQYSGTEGKRNRFREARLWHDPPEYYNPEGGLLVFKPDIPASMVKEALKPAGKLHVTNVDGHFNLANYQLKQIRNALAIAQSLGRTLVMPRMVCAFDRWWAPHHGKIPGASTKLPVDPCPMDHVFEVEAWLRPHPESEFGKDIQFREFSMLTNPRTPDEVKYDQVVVQVCNPAKGFSCSATVNSRTDLSPDAPLPSAGPRPRVEKLDMGLKDNQIREKLMQYKSVKVLHFTTMHGAFGGFSDPRDLEKFMKRTRNYVSLWCCVHAHPGHIWYDFWPDMKHVDRHNRNWDPAVTPWKPVTGP